jgi:flagellar hook-associated protein 3 FlgL
MTIRPFVAGNYAASSNATRLVNQRNAMDVLQQQLASQMRSDTYAGLGVQRVTSLEMRQKLSITEGYQATITDVAGRLKFSDLSLDRMGSISDEMNALIAPSSYSTTLNGQPLATNSARLKLDEMIDLLNSQYGGRYLFSGRSSDVAPVKTAQVILEGDATGDGLRTLMTERRTADTGTGTGRMTITPAGPSSVATLSEDGVHPFGLKFDTTLAASTRSTLSNATYAGPTGTPASMSVTFTGQPNSGEQLVFQFNMPDGSTKEIKLTANSNASVAANADEFRIGATPDDTAANLRAAMDLATRRETESTLRATSALMVSRDFFAPAPRANGNYFPQRIAAPVTGASTGFAADGARPTVAYYRGEDTPNPSPSPTPAITIRGQVSARIENGVSIGVGMRANEEGFGDIMAALAVYSLEDFTLPPNATGEQVFINRQKFEALGNRARDVMNGSDGGQTVRMLQVEMGNLAATVNGAKERQAQRANMFKDVISDVEGINKEEVAAKILAMQNNLQASYQVTSIVSQLSLVQYLR